MRVYLCGLKGAAEPGRELAFLRATEELAALGHYADSPYTTDLAHPDLTDRQALDLDRELISRAEAVVVLGDRGVACFETVFADLSGKPVIGFAEILRVAV